MLQNIAVQWLIRRIPDWGGWLLVPILGFLGFITSLSPSNQELVMNLLQGRWENITLGALIGFLAVIYANIISYRSTVKSQAIVSEDGKLVTNTLAPAKEREVKTVVEHVSSRKSLLDILKGN